MQTIHKIEDIRIAADTIGEAGMERNIVIPGDDFAATLANPEVSVTENLEIQYVLTREHDVVHAEIDIKGKLDVLCADCLSPVAYPLTLHLTTDYMPAAPDMPEDLEAERQSPSIGYYRKVIPLGEYILSETVLSLPLRFLCRPDCQGLCEQCGANLNEAPCTCEKQADPRLEKLAELKNKLRRK